MRAASIALLGLLLLAPAGCRSTAPSQAHTLDQVIASVPGDQRVTAVDLAVARKQLGLAGDAGTSKPGSQDAAERQLSTVAGSALPSLSTFDPALNKAFDLGRVRQAATGGLTPATRVTAMRFDGAAGDVLQKLVAMGWRQRSDVFESPRGRRSVQYAGQGQNELVLLSPSLTALQTARRGTVRGGAARALVESLRQPVRTAVAQGRASCLAVIGGGNQIRPPSGRIVAVPRAAPVASRLAKGRELEATRIEPAKIDGDRVVADFESRHGRARGQVTPPLIAQFAAMDVYRCR